MYDEFLSYYTPACESKFSCGYLYMNQKKRNDSVDVTAVNLKVVVD